MKQKSAAPVTTGNLSETLDEIFVRLTDTRALATHLNCRETGTYIGFALDDLRHARHCLGKAGKKRRTGNIQIRKWTKAEA